ncbi:GNAT family N-acetyltransferase [Brachyspira pilosicoli]|uniref:GNAT family N-acetyltransferase n=1 Tax=Brachyspira pilosicoli TaxID=52584 RepID=UPI00255D0573|nr:GNAT family N-acetyltransferase [Brachyspira pilosicoli]
MFKFCKFDIKNLDECIDLYIDVFSKYPYYEDNTFEDTKIYFNNLMKMNTNINFILKENNKIIALSLGFIKPYYTKQEYCLEQLCVLSSKQNKGVGSFFIKEITNYLKKEDISAIILNTENKYKAMDFYKKNGFIELSEFSILAYNI